MSEDAESFIHYLIVQKEQNRGAFAYLKRSLSFKPGSYPSVYPYVERFVGNDRHADDPWRKALYLTAALFALHPEHEPKVSFAEAFGELAKQRKNAGIESIEKRFITLLGAEPESLPTLLRQALSLLASTGNGFDFSRLLKDISRWLDPINHEGRDRLRQRWARDFYKMLEDKKEIADKSVSLSEEN